MRPRLIQVYDSRIPVTRKVLVVLAVEETDTVSADMACLMSAGPNTRQLLSTHQNDLVCSPLGDEIPL